MSTFLFNDIFYFYFFLILISLKIPFRVRTKEILKFLKYLGENVTVVVFYSHDNPILQANFRFPYLFTHYKRIFGIFLKFFFFIFMLFLVNFTLNSCFWNSFCNVNTFKYKWKIFFYGFSLYIFSFKIFI